MDELIGRVKVHQWEHLIVYATGAWTDKWEGETISLDDFLNKKGKEGWQLVQGPSYNHTSCIFKRPINN